MALFTPPHRSPPHAPRHYYSPDARVDTVSPSAWSILPKNARPATTRPSESEAERYKDTVLLAICEACWQQLCALLFVARGACGATHATRHDMRVTRCALIKIYRLCLCALHASLSKIFCSLRSHEASFTLSAAYAQQHEERSHA